jgi:hypothetical protein
MNTLEEAWRWYEHTRHALSLMRRLAAKHWGTLPWDGGLGKDDQFRHLEGAQVREEVGYGLDHLDDLAVVVLFSVFEAVVRERVLTEVAAEELGIRQRALRQAAEEARDRIKEGSFFHVLEPFKDRHAALVEEVNQVRRYRNWVAHGKRGKPPGVIEPRTAYRRLQRFLDATGQQVAVGDDWVI